MSSTKKSVEKSLSCTNIQEQLASKIKEETQATVTRASGPVEASNHCDVNVNDVANILSSGIPGMDENNLRIAEVWANEGVEKAVEKMFQHPKEKDGNDNPRPMSYSEMRYFYG